MSVINFAENIENTTQNLFDCVINNDYHGVKKIFEEGWIEDKWICLDDVPKNRHASLCWIAAYKQHNNILKLLLENGASTETNICGDISTKPLYHAIANNNVETVKLLVMHHCEVSCDDKRRSIRDGNADIINILLNRDQYDIDDESDWVSESDNESDWTMESGCLVGPYYHRKPRRLTHKSLKAEQDQSDL